MIGSFSIQHRWSIRSTGWLMKSLSIGVVILILRSFMPLYAVDLWSTLVVCAESEPAAVAHARDLAGSGALDATDFGAECQGEISAPAEIPDGWEPAGLPYGGDGRTIAQYLADGAK
jgi:hypothetical protein